MTASTEDFSTRTKLPFTGIILCGGKSSRMGRQKAFLPFGGSTLLEHRLRLMKSLFAEVILVTDKPDAVSHLSASVVKDILPNRGPLVGLLSGLLVASRERAFVCPCDMPLLSESLIRRICGAGRSQELTLLSHDKGVEPLVGVYSKSCINALEEAIFLGVHKSIDFVRSIQTNSYQLDEGTGQELPPYFNVDTPSDYGLLCHSV